MSDRQVIISDNTQLTDKIELMSQQIQWITEQMQLIMAMAATNPMARNAMKQMQARMRKAQNNGNRSDTDTNGTDRSGTDRTE